VEPLSHPKAEAFAHAVVPEPCLEPRNRPKKSSEKQEKVKELFSALRSPLLIKNAGA
jgi:hypothetical protein